MNSLPRRVAIIGAGISGLAAAQRLRELAPQCEVRVYESSRQAGGVLHTERTDGYLIEHSADNFITATPWAIQLCQRLGIAADLLSTDPRYRGAFVLHGGRLHRVPEGFQLLQPRRLWPIFTSSLLTWRGKLRLLGELMVPARLDGEDESLASFARRRLGREAFERLVQPLVAGIYTADAELLSLAATLPRFVEMEHQDGSLTLAAWQSSSVTAGSSEDDATRGARYRLFLAPRAGMSQLVQKLVERLPAGTLRLGERVDRLDRAADGGWQVTALGSVWWCDAVIAALPAQAAARLVRSLDDALAEELSGIPYADSAVVVLGYRREQVAHPLDGFGFVVPAVEQRRILAASFSSVKFPDRAPPGCVLIRVFLGGALDPGAVDLQDEELRRIAVGELAEILGIEGAPHLVRVLRWRGVMPQYHVGHQQRVARLRRRLRRHPGLHLIGSAYEGVGIPDCIRLAEEAVEATLHPTAPDNDPAWPAEETGSIDHSQPAALPAAPHPAAH